MGLGKKINEWEWMKWKLPSHTQKTTTTTFYSELSELWYVMYFDMLQSYHSFSHPLPPRLSSMFAQRMSIGFFSQNRSCACVRMWSGNELTVLKFDSCRFISSILWWFIFQVIFFFLFHFVVCVSVSTKHICMHVCYVHIVKSMYCFVY